MNSKIIEFDNTYINKIKELNKNQTKYYNILTMGCQLNENDSEKIAGMLNEMGYIKAENKDIADIYVFNTCCIRENAEEKLFGKLRRNQKNKGRK